MMIRLLCCTVLTLFILNQYAYAQEGRRAKSECDCAGFRCGISDRAGRVVGGKPTGRLDYPWAAQLTYGGKHFCAATLVTDEHLITAAHCITIITDKSRVEIVLGSYNKSDTTEASRKERKVGEWWPHPEYNKLKTAFNNDIAIIRLDRKVDFDLFVRPVCIHNNTISGNYVGARGIVAGWGRQGENGAPSDVLREIRVPIMSNAECKTKKYKPEEITSNMMCAGYDAGGIYSCLGDNGGALLHKTYTTGGATQIDRGWIPWNLHTGIHVHGFHQYYDKKWLLLS